MRKLLQKKIKELKKQGIFEAADFGIDVTDPPPCIEEVSKSIPRLPGLCNTTAVLKRMAEDLAKNEKMEIDNSKKVEDINVRTTEYVSFYKDDQCSIILFDKHVGELNTTLARAIRLQVESKKLPNDIFFNAQDKKTFLEDLEKSFHDSTK